MKKSHFQHLYPVSGYELAASARKGAVEIYGMSLDEVCLRHRNAVKKTVSYDLHAIEQGKYAIFMLSQIHNFPSSRQSEIVRHIVLLLETAVETLISLENRKNSKYRHIIQDFRRQLEIAAAL